MASKNVHAGEFPDQAIIDLGFEDGNSVGFMVGNMDIEEIYLSESKAQYDKIIELLETETTSDLTTVKRAFILPMHNVSTERLKAALKEHKISVTNDYEKADFIIPHTNFYDTYTQVDNIPQNKMMFKLYNGYFSNEHRQAVQDYHSDTGNNVILDKRALDGHSQWNLEYVSAPYDSFCFSKMSIILAKMVEDGELQVIETDTILNQSANRVPMTKELMEDIKKMIDGYDVSDEELEMAGKIIPTIDPAGEPFLLYEYSDFLENKSYQYTRNKDVQYWLQKHRILDLANCNAEQAIKYFEDKNMLDSRCFRALEVECRKEIHISNRELYTFKVQVKPEYRKYMK